MNETVARLVDAIKSGDALATETAFTDAMAEKLAPRAIVTGKQIGRAHV